MAENSPTSQITTIDRNEEMIGLAKENFTKYDYRQQIELLEGEAMDLLPTLPDKQYDFVFMDSAKSKYIVFLPEVLKKVKLGGLIVIDDIFHKVAMLRKRLETSAVVNGLFTRACIVYLTRPWTILM